MTESLTPQTHKRRSMMLLTAFGDHIRLGLQDPRVVDVLVNPDGRLWLDHHGSGRSDTGHVISASETERIIRLVASHMRQEIHQNAPIISGELPETGERFEGILPPLSPAPCFAIRKPAMRVYSLEDYVSDDILNQSQADALKKAVIKRSNILVVGGTGSGKTTLVNALLNELSSLEERVVLLEDTRELQCQAEDCVSLRTKPGIASLRDLVRSTLRLRPDRIIVGEVRGAEALDMLKAWNTGHPGGITTLHANSAKAGLYRLEQLIQETVVSVPRYLIADAIDLCVFIQGRGLSRRVETIGQLRDLTADGDYAFEEIHSETNE